MAARGCDLIFFSRGRPRLGCDLIFFSRGRPGAGCDLIFFRGAGQACGGCIRDFPICGQGTGHPEASQPALEALRAFFPRGWPGHLLRAFFSRARAGPAAAGFFFAGPAGPPCCGIFFSRGWPGPPAAGFFSAASLAAGFLFRGPGPRACCGIFISPPNKVSCSCEIKSLQRPSPDSSHNPGTQANAQIFVIPPGGSMANRKVFSWDLGTFLGVPQESVDCARRIADVLSLALFLRPCARGRQGHFQVLSSA